MEQTNKTKEIKCIKFPKIPQFRNVVKGVRERATFGGIDENGNVIRIRDAKQPKLKFKGTVKLHGTNAGIAYDSRGLRVQSRERIITPLDDNYGFARYVSENYDVFMGIIKTYIDDYRIDIDNNTIVLYGEWAGKGIQSGVAISQMDKSFFGFGVRVKPIVDGDFNDSDDEERKHPSMWLPIEGIDNSSHRIFNVNQFKQYDIEIDFDFAQQALIRFNEIVDEVEAECPIAKAFGFVGIGEGVVWSILYDGQYFMFKTKGEKHSKSKVKRVRTVDPQKMKSTSEFVEMVITEDRVRQGIENGAMGNTEMKSIGLVLKWVMRDVSTEESDTLEASGLTMKDVNGQMVGAIKKIFFKVSEEDAFN